MQAVTLEVILRAVFGVAEGPRLERLRGMLGDRARGNRLAARPSWSASRPGAGAARDPMARFESQLRDVDELLYAEIAEHRCRARPRASATTSSRC